MKKTDTSKKDKITTSTPTTNTRGVSTSSNITAASSGMEGDGSNSLFPDFHEEKKWASKTTKPDGDIV